MSYFCLYKFHIYHRRILFWNSPTSISKLSYPVHFKILCWIELFIFHKPFGIKIFLEEIFLCSNGFIFSWVFISTSSIIKFNKNLTQATKLLNFPIPCKLRLVYSNYFWTEWFICNHDWSVSYFFVSLYYRWGLETHKEVDKKYT